MICVALQVLLLLFLIEKSVSQNFENLAQLIENQKGKYNLSELSVAIVSPDSVLYSYGGEAQYQIDKYQEPLVSLAVLRLANDGLLQLDRPLEYYLPWFSLRDKVAAKSVTVRNLLNQTAGFAPECGYEYPKNKAEWEQFLKHIELKNEPGDEFLASQLNFALLGFLVAEVSGTTFENFVATNIFQKIGMKNTNFEFGQILVPNQFLFGLLKINIAPAPNQLNTSASDLGLFLSCLLKDGACLSRDTLLKKNLLRQYFTPKYAHYSMGWKLSGRNGGNFFQYQHFGKSDATFLGLLPEQKLGIVLISNTNTVTACPEIAENILNFIEKKPHNSFFLKEFYVRISILLLFLWTFIEFCGRLKLWQRYEFKIKFKFKFRIIFGLFVGLLINILFLYLVPLFIAVPIHALIEWQPDMGYALVVGAGLGILSAFILAFVRSNS